METRSIGSFSRSTICAARGLMRAPGTTMPARFSGSAAGIRNAISERRAADRPQQIDRFGSRELLAEKAGDEAAAANFAARFHAPQRDQQVAPRRRQRFSREQIAEHDAPAQQQLTRKCFGAFVRRMRIRQGCSQQRPASGRMPRHLQPRTSFAAPALGIDQRAQIFESVGGDQSRSRQFPHPSSTSLVSRPVACASSGRNEAPRCRSASRHFAAGCVKCRRSAAAPIRASQGASSRRKIATGATRVGRTRRAARAGVFALRTMDAATAGPT